MRFQQYINELLKVNPKLVKVVGRGKEYVEYESVDFVGDPKDELEVTVAMQKDVESWEVLFALYGNYQGEFPDTTVKETIQILNIVISAIDDWLKKVKPDVFFFSEETSLKGGFKLYKKFAQQIVKRHPYKQVRHPHPKIFKFQRIK